MNKGMTMGRCCYCNETIRAGEDFILKGQYPRIGEKLFGRHQLFWGLLVPDVFGTIYHRSCFFKETRSRTPQSETIVREGKIMKQCPQCGVEFSKDFKFCPYCGGFVHVQ